MEFRNLTRVGLLTLVIIMVPGITWELHNGTLATARALGWIAALAAFACCFVVCTRGGCEPRTAVLLTAVESALALFCVSLQPNPFTAVLLVIVAGQLGRLPVRMAVLWIVVQSALLWFLIFMRTDSSFSTVTAYFAFQLFGFFTIRIAHQELVMRQALAEANTELKVATGLLEIESRSEERLRISRDLHDLIGHHLTALSLNLEVATHLTEGNAREQIEKSKALAKLLLSDVRDVVGRLRVNEPIDLGFAVRALRDVIGGPALHLAVAPDLSVNDPELAKVALRAIQEIVTNAVRHSGARNLWLSVVNEDHRLAIDARDDGVGSDDVRFGNGLKGMRERIEEIRGSLQVKSLRGSGFEVHVQLPLTEAGR
jgi:signal transduction histidine kinase